MRRPVSCWPTGISACPPRSRQRRCGSSLSPGTRGWRMAAAAADGQVIQFLAGAPELLARYQYAPPTARALISAAIDARRLGMGLALPAGLPGSGRARVPDRHRLGHPWRGLAGTGAGLHRRAGKGRPRPADPHPPPPLRQRRRAGLPAGRLPGPARPPRPPRPPPPGGILGCGGPLRQPRRAGRPRQGRRGPRPTA